MNSYLAIDIGGTNTKFALIDKNGSIIQKYRIPTKSDSFESLVSDIKNSIGAHIKDIKAIGIGAPDVSTDKLRIENANNLFFRDADVVKIFSEEFKVPTFLENDANIASMGEKEFGVAKEFKSFIVLTIGTGLGSGVYLGDSLYQGALGMGSEIGHLIYEPNGRLCSCGQKGHAEAYLSCPGICKTHLDLSGNKIGFSDFVELINKNDKTALKSLDLVSRHFAEVCASLDASLNPEAIVLAGGGSILGKKFLKLIQEKFKDLQYPNFKGQSKILLSDFTPEYGAIMGAFSLSKLK